MPAVYTRNGRIILRNGLPVVGDCCCTEEDRRKRCVRAEIEVVVAYSTTQTSPIPWDDLPSQAEAEAKSKDVKDSSILFDPSPAGVADTSVNMQGTAPWEAAVETSNRSRQGDEILSIVRGTGTVTFRAVVRNLGRIRIEFHPGLVLGYQQTIGDTRPSGRHTYVQDGVTASLSIVDATRCSVVQNPAWPASWNPGFVLANLAYANEVWALELEVVRP